MQKPSLNLPKYKIQMRCNIDNLIEISQKSVDMGTANALWYKYKKEYVFKNI